MRRILIVCPAFPPANGADSHRVRTIVPFLKEAGWNAEILAIEPKCLTVPQDAWLLAGVPQEIPIHRCGTISLKWSFLPGFGTLDMRAWRSMRRLGAQLLSKERFDLIYFSTTSFRLTALGIGWKKKFGIPFVVDYQDPWITDYYRLNPTVTPPGGRLKYWGIDRIARLQEPRVLRSCAGITAVSPAYPVQLQQRYGELGTLPNLVIPFPGAQRDFDRLDAGNSQSLFDKRDGHTHWVYVGVSGPIMYKTLGAFFSSIARWRQQSPTDVAGLRMHFIGTSYAPAGTAAPAVLPIAQQHGVADLVQEVPDRVPYSTALCCLRDADALLAPGSNDASYNASKLLPYILARKPLLAIFHQDSPATTLLREIGGANLVSFASHDSEDEISNHIAESWIIHKQYKSVSDVKRESLAMYTDRGQAHLLCDFFEHVLVQSLSIR